MKADELMEIALANADAMRVEVTGLQPAGIATGAVSGLAQLIAELVDNALSFSEPDDAVLVSGLFDQDDYLISVSDTGVGISEHFMNALNRVLEDPNLHVGGPGPRLGIQLVARLAARNGIRVRLVPGRSGTTARVSVPARLVSRIEAEVRHEQEEPVFAEVTSPLQQRAPSGAPRTKPSGLGRTIDLTRFEANPPLELGEPPPEETISIDVEEFLESVFSPLAGGGAEAGRPTARPETTKASARPVSPPQPVPSYGAGLRVRVPGENFSIPDDEPSATAGEAAVDIRQALSSYDIGRRTAADEPGAGKRPSA